MPITGPAVDLTFRVRIPCPQLEDAHVEWGITSLPELVTEQLESLVSAPDELAEFFAEHEVEYTFEIDDDTGFDGGGGSWAPREFHTLGEE